MAIDKNESPFVPLTDGGGVAEAAVPWKRIESFIAQLAHDVRNGLNACELQLTFLGEICQEPEAADEVKRLRSSLVAITKHLQALRTATAPVTIYPLEYPAPDFFEDLRERFLKIHFDNAPRVQWTSELDPAFTLQADPGLSIQACLELLDNALKFEKKPGSFIGLTARNSDHAAIFTLREEPMTAPAIPPERWGREPLSSTRRGAYGLGLFRVRRILEGENGSLEIHYDAEANHLVSVLTLPGSAQK